MSFTLLTITTPKTTHNFMKILIILSIFLILTNAYHANRMHTLFSSNNRLHFQQSTSQADDTNYLNKLQALQTNLKTKIAQLKTKATNINNNLTNYSQFPTVQNKILVDGLSSQRQDIYNINSNLILPVNNNTRNCQNLTEQQTKSITDKISETQKKVNQLNEQIQKQTSKDCIWLDQLKNQVKFLERYLSQMSKQVANTCNNSTPVGGNKFYVLNSMAQNYTYGKNANDQQKYNNQVQDYLNKGYLKIQCPLQTPYPYSFQQCVACPDGSHYDLSSNACLTCQAGFVFSTTEHVCKKFSMNSNPSVQNFKGSRPITDSNSPTCPNQKPYFNGQQCIACQSPSFFNFNTLTCELCANGLVFLKDSKTCGYKQWNTNPQAGNVCCGAIPMDPNLKSCPDDRPFFNGRQCIQCTLPSYFNLQTHSCTFCPTGQGFSTKQHKCVSQKFLGVGYTSTLGPTSQNYMGTAPPTDNRYISTEPCPQNYPFFNGKDCIACALPNYFNFQSGLCEVCAAGTKFNIQTHQCEIIPASQTMNTNIAVINNFRGSIPNYNESSSTCPNTKPYFNGLTCIQCQLPSYFNFDTKKCQSCAENMKFNTVSKQCQIGVPTAYTNPQTNNIYYNGNYNDITNKINQQKQSNPSLQACPSDKPFYNAISGVCQNCPSQYPLFDIKYNRCIACTGNSKYNKDERVCLATGVIQPTVQRMLMNTIGF